VQKAATDMPSKKVSKLFEVKKEKITGDLKDYLRNHKIDIDAPYVSSGSDKAGGKKFGESGTPTWGEKFN
jgi:hypothetical protein